MPKARPSDSSADPPDEEIPFEVALARLEAVVDRLEQGDLELEQSLSAFEEGVRLSKRCAAQLDGAEQRIEVLIREGGKWMARPFAGEELAAGADEDEDVD